MAVKRELAGHRRRGDFNGWFDLAAPLAIEHLHQRGVVDPRGRLSDPTPQLPVRDLHYDDWREQGARTRALRWHLWLFQEQGSDTRLKLSYGAPYDTAYHYAFTYNPWPVRLIAGFEHARAVAAEHRDNEPCSARIREAWENAQRKLGNLASEQVGWLNPGVRPIEVDELLRRFEIRPFPLDRPKQPGARVRDASVNPPVPIGCVPSLRRVAADPTIYGPAGCSGHPAGSTTRPSLLQRLFG
jgi:hypothetical protein